MSFADAIKTCFRKYFTFSGRASRPEYWYFFLFIILGNIAAGIVDSALFGAATVETGADGEIRAQNNGPVGALFGLVTFIPSLSAGWRRMHDTGRSGLYLLYPLIVMVGIGSFAAFTGALSDGGFESIEGIAFTILIIGGIVFLLSPIVVLWWLTRPSEPGSNEYGPNPKEVLQ